MNPCNITLTSSFCDVPWCSCLFSHRPEIDLHSCSISGPQFVELEGSALCYMTVNIYKAKKSSSSSSGMVARKPRPSSVIVSTGSIHSKESLGSSPRAI